MNKHHHFGLSLVLVSSFVWAQSPTTCVTGKFSYTNSQSNQVNLEITNGCSQGEDFQNSIIKFQSPQGLASSTNFWGTTGFVPLSYPTNTLTITDAGDGKSSFTLVFPTYSGANSVLPAGQSFSITFNVQNPGSTIPPLPDANLEAYLSGKNNPTGSINLSLSPSGFSATTLPSFTLTDSKNTTQSYTAKWTSSTQKFANIPSGSYTVSASAVKDANGVNYIAMPKPSSLSIQANQATNLTITYSKPPTQGSLSLTSTAPGIATQVANPVVTLTPKSGGTETMTGAWGKAVTNAFPAGVSYDLSSPNITYDTYNCLAKFDPASIILQENKTSAVNLSYQCSEAEAIKVTLAVDNLSPAQEGQVTISFIDTLTHQVITAKGTDTSVNLFSGRQYSVTASPIQNLDVTIGPTPPISPNQTQKIVVTYSSVTPQGNGITCKLIDP